jgi:hypothetical protein
MQAFHDVFSSFVLVSQRWLNVFDSVAAAALEIRCCDPARAAIAYTLICVIRRQIPSHFQKDFCGGSRLRKASEEPALLGYNPAHKDGDDHPAHP